MIIDFKEIPITNRSKIGNSDSFEFFAREFLKELGYRIINDPARGPDGGVDLIVGEKTNLGEIKWLVSCKHYANGGSTVGTTQEQNISDRIDSSGCDGFMGFYSTHASQFLMDNLDKKKSKYAYYIFDSEKIERYIIGDLKFDKLFLRFFPDSFSKVRKLLSMNFPIKLLDYYIDNEDLNINVFDYIFKTRLSFMKSIINNESLDSSLEMENISIDVVENIRNEIKSYPELNKLDYLNATNRYVQVTHANSVLICSGWHQKYGEYLLLTNVLVIDQKYYEAFRRDYNKLKQLLSTT